MTIFGALIGLGILCATVMWGNKLENRLLRYLAAAVGIMIGLAAAGYIAGDEAGKAGEYMVYMAVPALILKKIFA